MDDLIIGCHLSISKGFLSAGKTCLNIKGNTFQFFTRNPRGSSAKEWSDEDIDAFSRFCTEHHFAPPMAHAPYTLNPASTDSRVRDFALTVVKDDLRRLKKLPDTFYNFHPGSHVGKGVSTGIKAIADLLNECLSARQPNIVLLETMAGKGTEIGGKFEEIKQIINAVHLKEKIGVCLDTCHVFDAGYDIVHQLDDVLDTFDRLIGLSFLKAIHLNDSKNPLSSRKDRHETLGNGFLGKETFRKIVTDKRLRHLPFYLETPNDLNGYAMEIDWLKQQKLNEKR